MDDFYTLDLLKLERFHCLKDCPTDALEWNESDESDDDSDDDDSDGSSSEDDEPAEQEGEEMREADLLEELEWLGDEGMSDEAIAAAKQALLEKEELRKKAKVFMGVALDSTRSEADMLSTPLPGASCGERRASTHADSVWQARRCVSSTSAPRPTGSARRTSRATSRTAARSCAATALL